MEAINETLSNLSDVFHNKMNEFEQRSLKQQSTTATTSGSLEVEFMMFKKFITEALQSLQSQVDLVAQELDKQEMRSRRKFLLFHGVIENKVDSPAATLNQKVISKLLCKIPQFSLDDISRFHRIGQKSGDKPRPILVKFKDMGLREKVWFGKTVFKGSGITISEFLTKPRHDTFLTAREQFGINNCWTRNGNIIVVQPDGSKHYVRSVKELKQLSSTVKSDSSKECPTAVASKPSATKSTRKGAKK